MTSDPAFVWIWLPASTEPVVAGRIDRDGDAYTYAYGRSYLDRADAIPIYLPELPLHRGRQQPRVGQIAGCLRDAAPDGWGQRVIENRHAAAGTLDIVTYLLESGSNRPGALDFQTSASDYAQRGTTGASLAELLRSAERVEAGVPLDPKIDHALLHGTSVGGARPKATITTDDRQCIAKFESSTDTLPMVRYEFVGMRLAAVCGIDVASVEIVDVAGRAVLLVERFDRPPDGSRLAMVSALTILGLDELGGRDAAYPDLADHIRARFTGPDESLRELFRRIVFNVVVGNTDDHARNHAAFWDGSMLRLTPAYDVCPYPRAGGQAAQVMAIDRDGRRDSNLTLCVDAAAIYHLDRGSAQAIVDEVVAGVDAHFDAVCDAAALTEVDRIRLRTSAVLHESIFYD